MRPATQLLAAVLVALFATPALASHPSKRRHARADHGSRPRHTRHHGHPAAPSPGISTYEPFGPPRPADLEEAPDVIDRIAVLNEPSPDPKSVADTDCPGQDFVASVCRGGPAEAGDSPDRLAGVGAIRSSGNLAAALQWAGDLFRAKSPVAEVSPQDVDLGELLAMNLAIPVQGITPAQLRDSFEEARGSRRRRREHMALDIGAPRGTPVLATTDGEILRFGRERRGGKAVYLKDSSRRYLFYYCHLSKFAKGLRAGEPVKKGDVLGYVGATGNAHGAHLHFSVTRLPDDSTDYRRGLAVNPYVIFLVAAAHP